MKDMHQAFIT